MSQNDNLSDCDFALHATRQTRILESMEGHFPLLGCVEGSLQGSLDFKTDCQCYLISFLVSYDTL
jgi:hypothetical protein